MFFVTIRTNNLYIQLHINKADVGRMKMRKKIIIISVLAVFMLVAISFASAVDTATSAEKKESPLFKIRLQNAIRDKKQIVQERINNFFVKLIGDRLFLRIPLMKRDVDNGPYVLSRGAPCTVVKCTLEKEDTPGLDWTKSQPICSK